MEIRNIFTELQMHLITILKINVKDNGDMNIAVFEADKQI
jgi:hypothetical protein